MIQLLLWILSINILCGLAVSHQSVMLAQQFNGDFADISDKDLEDTVSEKRDRQRKYKRGTKWLSSVSGLEEEQLKLILFEKGRLRPFYRRKFEQLFTDYQE